jgi:iron complex transport system substrate-binding protein
MYAKVCLKSKFKSILLYLAMICFVLGWWTLALQAPSSLAKAPFLSKNTDLSLNTSMLIAELGPIQRHLLHEALAGNARLMIDFISQWDKEARALIGKGVEGIQILTENNYLRVHAIAQLIHASTADHLNLLNRQFRLKTVFDDAGNPLTVEDSSKFNRFLPQTYLTASFLLAIAPPREIIALPAGLRNLPQLYSPSLLNQIPDSSDRFDSERTYAKKPHLAFTAHYSHPSTLARFRRQGIPIFTINHIDTLADIPQALLKVGHAANHPLEASLLAGFFEAAFFAIDNRLKAAHQLCCKGLEQKKLLYLSHSSHYTVPTTRSLTGQLLQRALLHFPTYVCPIQNSSTEWNVSFEQEDILQSQAECVILSTQPGLNELQFNSPIFQALPAFKNGSLFCLDENVQTSPTQYAVLAYYDLHLALLNLEKSIREDAFTIGECAVSRLN